jgi:hypothetical protein
VRNLFTPRGVTEFTRHVVPAVIKPARTLWNEVIGFFFLCLSVLFGSGVWRSYRAFMKASPDEATGDLLRIGMSLFCTVLMLYFGVSSFRRARKISRS